MLWDRKGSEPLGASFAGRVAVVFRGLTLEVERDVALLLSIGSRGFDGIHLLAIPERHLNSEGAVGGERHFFSTDGEASGRVSGAVDDQFGVSYQPEGALAGSHATKARLVAAAGPEASPRVIQATAVAGNVKALLEFFRANPTAAELNRGEYHPII